jgi:hypothetical protein
MRYLLGCFLLASSVVYADTPPAFDADPSKPSPDVNIPTAQPDNKPVTPQSKSAWHDYDKPLAECVQGDTIIPSANNSVLSFLFSNTTDTNVTMSVVGWKKSKCSVNFSEGTFIKSCQLSSPQMKMLMDSLLDSSQFDPNGSFAQVLTSNCQNSQS